MGDWRELKEASARLLGALQQQPHQDLVDVAQLVVMAQSKEVRGGAVRTTSCTRPRLTRGAETRTDSSISGALIRGTSCCSRGAIPVKARAARGAV